MKRMIFSRTSITFRVSVIFIDKADGYVKAHRGGIVGVLCGDIMPLAWNKSEKNQKKKTHYLVRMMGPDMDTSHLGNKV